MIRYSDYNGPQDDVVVRDGRVVPFDRNAAREMARHAHALAGNASRMRVARFRGTAWAGGLRRS